MSVTGSFTIDAPLATMGLTDIRASVLSYSFTDGRGTLTESNSLIDEFSVAVDGSGQITNWQVLFDGPRSSSLNDPFSFFIGTTNMTPGTLRDSGIFAECSIATRCFDESNPLFLDEAEINGLPGSWTAVVPVPAAVWLFGSGLLGLVGMARRKA